MGSRAIFFRVFGRFSAVSARDELAIALVFGRRADDEREVALRPHETTVGPSVIRPRVITAAQCSAPSRMKKSREHGRTFKRSPVRTHPLALDGLSRARLARAWRE